MRIGLFAVLPIIILFLFTSCAIVVNADPIPLPPSPWDQDTSFRSSDLLGGFIWTTVLNYAVNLLFFSLLFIIAVRKYGAGVAEISAKRMRFFGRLFIAVLIISVVGSLIDMIFLMGYSPFGDYRLIFNSYNWSIAAVMIFLSIFAIGVLIMRIHLKPDIIIASAMAVINLIFWLMIWRFGEIVSFATLLLSLAFLAAPLSKLLYWHMKLHAKPTEA